MTTYSYLRVSLEELHTDNQRKMIEDAGFSVDEYVCEEGVSGSTKAMERPEFSKMISKAQKGDRVICTMIDRLGRSASDVLNTIEELQERGIHVVILQFGGIDVTSSMGKMICTVMAACAELERNLLKERTVAGIQRTKAQGTKLGPPMKITPDEFEEIVKEKNSGVSVEKISMRRNLAQSTVYNNLKHWGTNVQGYRKEFSLRQAQYEKQRVNMQHK